MASDVSTQTERTGTRQTVITCFSVKFTSVIFAAKWNGMHNASLTTYRIYMNSSIKYTAFMDVILEGPEVKEEFM